MRLLIHTWEGVGEEVRKLAKHLLLVSEVSRESKTELELWCDKERLDALSRDQSTLRACLACECRVCRALIKDDRLLSKV